MTSKTCSRLLTEHEIVRGTHSEDWSVAFLVLVEDEADGLSIFWLVERRETEFVDRSAGIRVFFFSYLRIHVANLAFSVSVQVPICGPIMFCVQQQILLGI